LSEQIREWAEQELLLLLHHELGMMRDVEAVEGKKRRKNQLEDPASAGGGGLCKKEVTRGGKQCLGEQLGGEEKLQ
jgi:hypothetical protein